MERPLISYVVMAYNIEKYIAESVQCAFDQTYSPLEIVLSDDGSTDRTYEIMAQMAAAYHGPHTVILNRNCTNLGITAHMNKAYLELAHGELIVAAHGDDLSLPERTEKSWTFLSSHTDFTAVSFSLDAIDEEGKCLNQHSAVVDLPHYYSLQSDGNIPAPSRCFYKRVMEQFGPMNQDCPTEDEIISFRALLLGENAFLPEHMVKYRKHSGSASNPENFNKFPLELILKQQDDDMKKAVAMGLITEELHKQKYESMYANMLIRKQYRKYYASHSIKDLYGLLFCSGISIKRRIRYCKQYIMWKLNR